MARLTTLQKTQLNNSNKAMQSGQIGTRIDSLEYGSARVPATGSLLSLSAMKYVTTPAIGTATYVHAAVALTDEPQDVATGFTNPDFARILTVKGNASGIAGDVVITGTNIIDAVITDTIALNGATEVLGVKAFKTVTSINLPAETHAGTDTVSIGVGNKIGFPIAIPNASTVIAKTFDGAVDSSTITVAATIEGSLAAVAGTFNGTKIYELVFLA